MYLFPLSPTWQILITSEISNVIKQSSVLLQTSTFLQQS